MQSVHIKKVQPQQAPLSCKVYEMIFVDRLDLEGHITRQHTTTHESQLESESNLEESEIFNCDKCTFITKEDVVFRQHVLTTHVPGFECHECETVIKPKDLVAGCSVCEFFFHKKCTNLAKTQGGHWKPKSWKCHYCSSKPATSEDTIENAKNSITEKVPETSDYNKISFNTRHRKSNLNLDKPDIEFLQSQLDSCRGVIAQREAELKKLKESDSLKAKRIMQLEAQLQEARHQITKSSKPTEEPVHIPLLDAIPTNLNNKDYVKVLLLEEKTNTLEHQITSLFSKIDSLQAIFLSRNQPSSGSFPDSVKRSTTVNEESTDDDVVETSRDRIADTGESIYSTNPLFTCDVCHEKLPCFDDLQKHIDKHHGKQQHIFKCQECEFKSEVEVSYNLHMVTHMNTFSKCDACSYIAIHSKDLGRHKKTMHAAHAPFACKQCDFCSPSRDQFQEHCQLAHEKHYETRTFSRNHNVKSKCHKCNYQAENRHDMFRHLKTMHRGASTGLPSHDLKPSSTTTRPASSSTQSTTETATPSAKRFNCSGPCDGLQKSFDHQDEYDLHMDFFHTTQ